MSKILLKNIHTLMTDPRKKDQSGVDLLIVDNLIEKIQKNIKVERGVRVIDCSNLVVIPGMVNTHHHFYQTLTRNLPDVQNAKLFNWLTYLYEIWKGIDDEAVYYSSLTAIAELLKSGCTTTTDHHYLYPKNFKGDIMAIQFEAADMLGIRFSPTRGSMSLSKKDGGLPPDSVVQDVDTILKHSEECIQKFHDKDGMAMHKIVLAPCSPFSVTKECMKESAKLARKYKVHLHTHLCETMDEEDNCKAMYGLRPLALMEECDLIGNDVFYAHGIWFNDDELKILKETGSHIAHCPSSNMRLGSGICRVKEMLAMGINVGLAVDGSASNDSSSMLLEARTALYLQRVKYGSDALSARDVFKMASENGAKMLGFKKVGRLEEGWAADIAIFDSNTDLSFAGSQSDSVASLLFCTPKDAKYTIVNGKLAVDNYHLVGFDEEWLVKMQNESAKKLYKKAGII